MQIMQPGALTWESLRQYCVPLWYDDGMKLQRIVEKLSLMEFTKTKNPDDVILYYIILNKLQILIALYKAQSPPNPKMVTFLSKDFKDPSCKSAAGKNAFVLLSQKRFFMSAAFFLLAGKLSEAVDVIINNMQDIQLAILVCRL